MHDRVRLGSRGSDSDAESGTTRVRLGSRGSDSGAESRTELCNSEYESARDGPTRRYESEDRRPDWVRERGRELGQKSPTRDPHEGPSRTEFTVRSQLPYRPVATLPI